MVCAVSFKSSEAIWYLCVRNRQVIYSWWINEGTMWSNESMNRLTWFTKSVWMIHSWIGRVHLTHWVRDPVAFFLFIFSWVEDYEWITKNESYSALEWLESESIVWFAQELGLTELFYYCLEFFVQMLNLSYVLPPEGTSCHTSEKPSRDADLRSLPTLSHRPLKHTTGPTSLWQSTVTMGTNRERQVGHMTGFPPAVYPFAFNSMRSHSPFDLLANSSLFGRFGADLPKEMAALCEYWTCCAFIYLQNWHWILTKDLVLVTFEVFFMSFFFFWFKRRLTFYACYPNFKNISSRCEFLHSIVFNFFLHFYNMCKTESDLHWQPFKILY